MHDVNWWLMALAFVLGLVLTWAFTIRRVKREVPVSVERTRQGFAGRDVGVRGPDVDVKPAGAAGAAGVGAVAAASFAGRKPSAAEPYGAGPVRAGAGGSGPAGYTVKGNEDSMLYHTPDSPSYKQTIAEVWFRDEESAVRGGFTRWDRGRRN